RPPWSTVRNNASRAQRPGDTRRRKKSAVSRHDRSEYTDQNEEPQIFSVYVNADRVAAKIPPRGDSQARVNPVISSARLWQASKTSKGWAACKTCHSLASLATGGSHGHVQGENTNHRVRRQHGCRDIGVSRILCASALRGAKNGFHSLRPGDQRRLHDTGPGR